MKKNPIKGVEIKKSFDQKKSYEATQIFDCFLSIKKFSFFIWNSYLLYYVVMYLHFFCM